MDLLVGYAVYLGEENRVCEAVVVNEDSSEENAKSGRGKVNIWGWVLVCANCE